MALKRVVVCGRPGSGKSTYVNEQRKPNDLVWDWDAVAETLFGTEDLTDANRGVMLRLLDFVLMQGVRTTHPIYVITTGTRWANDIAQKIRGEVVVLDTPADVCIERIAQRESDTPRRRKRMEVVREWSK